MKEGFCTDVVSDAQILSTIQESYAKEGYLLDPHAAVAVAAAKKHLGSQHPKILCLATAHPCKFPGVIRQALGQGELPPAAIHPSIEEAKGLCQRIFRCDFEDMYTAIPNTMRLYHNRPIPKV